MAWRRLALTHGQKMPCMFAPFARRIIWRHSALAIWPRGRRRRRALKLYSPLTISTAPTASASSRQWRINPPWPNALARFKGEAVAVIAGDREAVLALDPAAFPITWTPLDATLEPDAAMLPDARLLHNSRPGNILIRGRVAQGDAEAGLAAAAHVVEGAFETSFVEHAYIEPEAGAAWMDGDTLVIQACTQAPVMDQDDVANVLGVPAWRVRIIPTAAGGGFGSKLDVSLQPLIGLVSLKTGRPCRMVYTRGESMASTTKRHASRMSARIGVRRRGPRYRHGVRGRFQHRSICELGADGR